MSKSCLIIFVFVLQNSLFGQQDFAINQYRKFTTKADSLYNAKDYKNSGHAYSSAFKYASSSNDRYNAACSWALAGYPDSAFFQLNLIASNYHDYNHISTDSDLNSLHNDERWIPLIEIIKHSKEKSEEKRNKPLVAKLDSIYNDDQSYRIKAQELQKKHGSNSEEFKALWKTVHIKDSINLIKVTTILDKYGWLGSEEVGSQGNTTLFLVIQHADLKTQEKYLPMMREAVKNGKAYGSSLALLEDRIEIRNGRKQIYGSQIGMTEDNKYYVSPLLDPDNVNKRRASVGLGTLEEYVKNWGIKWDVEQYKKDLPHLIEIQKKY